MRRGSYTHLLLALLVAVISISWSTQVLAAQRLQMGTEPSVPGSATTLIVSYEGEAAFVAADLVLTITGGLDVTETSGRLGSGLYTSDWSWDHFSREVRISLNSADLFSGHIAEIPLTVSPGGGYIELELLSAYDDLILNITDDLDPEPLYYQLTPSGLTRVDMIPGAPAPGGSTEQTEPTTHLAATTNEDETSAVPDDTASDSGEEPVTGTEETSSDDQGAAEPDDGTDLAPETQNTSPLSDLDRTQEDDSLVESSQASEQITDDSDLNLQPNTTALHAEDGMATMETSEQPLAPSDPDSEEGDISSGNLATQLNRILRVLVIVLLIAVAGVLIVLLIQYQRRRQ